jgi:hypothetical protein
MGEEGPEVTELLEQSEKNKHVVEHGEGDAKKKRFTMMSAITASILAVLAALGSLLSGHAANEAILKQAQASDKWAFYQAKSTKSHIFEGSKSVVQAIANEDGKIGSPAVIKVLADFDSRIKKYDGEKDDIQKEASATEKESAELFEKHHNYSFGVACFQIGIVLASVAILVASRYMYFGSIASGILGIAFLIYGFLR